MKISLLGGVSLLSLIAVNGAAFADSAGIETVTVTAERRAESAQHVGIALTVLSADDLVKRGVVKVNQLQYSTPNLEIVPAFGSGQPEFRLRGVGFDDYGSNNTSTVGVYVDEVAYPVPAQTQGNLFDIQRVEVLRGPQGTLYGRNTTGGAINFITNKPTDEFTAGITAEFDSHDEFRADGYVSGPVSDNLLFRLAATTDQGGSWQKNRETGQSLGDKNTSAVRGQLQWDASSKVSFLLEGHYGYDKSQPDGLYLFTPIAAGAFGAEPATTVPAFTKTTQTGWGGSAAFGDLIGKSPDVKPFHDSDNAGVNLHTNADLGFAQLTAITSYEDLHRREYNDWDASSYALAGTYFDTHAHVFSQEIRLASNDEGPFTWLTGFYYDHESLDDDFVSDFWQSLGFVTQTSYHQNVDSLALFAQTEYHFTDKLKLVTGLRGEDEHRKQSDYVTKGVLAPGAPPTAFSPGADKSLHNQRLSGKAELEYNPEENTLLYASVSEGVKSGGFTSYNVPDSSLVAAVKPEVLWAYEGGFKSTFADDTVQLNGAAFYYDYTDQQVQSSISSIYGPIGAIVNAPKSHLWGGELELNWNPIEGLRIGQQLGWTDGQFDKYFFLNSSSGILQNDKGDREGFPPLSYGGSVSYDWDLGGYTLQPEVDYAFHGHNDPILLQQLASGAGLAPDTYNTKSYWLFNANLTLTPDNQPWSVAVFGRNIFNAKYDTTRNSFLLPVINIAQRGEPATVGVRFSYKY